MIRTILGVVAGYIAMSVVLFVLFSVLYTVLGTSGSFMPDSLYVSTTWLIAGFIIFFAGAAVAGIVSKLIGKTSKSAMVMGIVILVVGGLMAFSQIAQMPESMVREAAEVPMMEAMAIAQNPVWALFLNPIIGLLGAIVGGMLIGSKE
ncbi:MAG: hypothetical protein OEM82_09095 [Acidobacteriota bacterium]|nr:hypothetical protein [Acidobacteriota bacterium]